MVSRVVLGFVLVLGLGSCARNLSSAKQPELPKPSRELDLPTSGYLKTYPNGLTLFVVPDSYTRLVQFDVRQQVGSREDPEGKGGMAHFVEHLMFQLHSDGPDSPKLMSDIPQHALTFNAYTSSDETHYMHTGTADELEKYMQYTALRLNYDCDDVSENAFLRERDVVRNEHRWRGERVDVLVRDKVLELAFPEGHPYRANTFGSDEDLASITPEDTCKFIRRYYSASQASVIVTGDVDPTKVLELANEYLKPLPKVAAPPRIQVPPPKFATHEAEVVAPVKKPTSIVLFAMPKRFTKDYAASQAAFETLLLAVSFFTTTRESVVKDWYVAFFGGKEAPVLGVAVETKEPEQLARATDEVLDAISRGFAADVSGKEYRGSYDSARQRARLGVLDRVGSVFGASNSYADYLEEGANPGFIGADISELDDLTSEHAQEVGRRVFARKKALVVQVVPDGSKEKPQAERASFDYEPKDDENLALPDDIDPDEASRPLPFEDIAPPEGQSLEYELDNGMKVVLVQSSQVPVMDVQVIVGAGLDDAPGQRVLATMASRAFTTRDDLEGRNLMTFFDRAGGIYFDNVGPQATTFSSRGLSIYLDFIVAGMSERVVQAEYRTGALEIWKQRRKEELKKKSTLQGYERENRFYEALYGKGHPHVRRTITDRKQLRDVSLRDLEKFRSTHYRAGNSAVIMTGGFDMELAMKYIERFFGQPRLRDKRIQWNEPKATADRGAAAEPKPSSIRHFTEMDKERVQTDIRLAYPLAEAYGKDHASLMVMANMLNFLVSAVRMELGASYGVYARLDNGRPRIEIGGALDSARAGEAVLAIRNAIDKLRKHEDFDRQFAFARRNVLKSMINAQGDPRLLAGQLAQAVQAGRSYEYFRKLADRVANLKPSDVHAQIKRVLVDSKSVMLIQGPADGIADVLAKNEIKGATKLPDVVHDEEE